MRDVERRFALPWSIYSLNSMASSRYQIRQAFRKFGSAIEMRANIDGPGQLSRVASHKRLFSSDRILGAEALAGERGCESSDSASGEGREEPVGQLVSAAAGRDRLSQST